MGVGHPTQDTRWWTRTAVFAHRHKLFFWTFTYFTCSALPVGLRAHADSSRAEEAFAFLRSELLGQGRHRGQGTVLVFPLGNRLRCCFDGGGAQRRNGADLQAGSWLRGGKRSAVTCAREQVGARGEVPVSDRKQSPQQIFAPERSCVEQGRGRRSHQLLRSKEVLKVNDLPHAREQEKQGLE